MQLESMWAGRTDLTTGNGNLVLSLVAGTRCASERNGNIAVTVGTVRD